MAPLAWGWYGVVSLLLIPNFLVKATQTEEVKYGPLSEMIC